MAAALIFIVLSAGCANSIGKKAKAINEEYKGNLAQARTHFKTVLTDEWVEGVSVPNPPNGIFNVVNYSSSVGRLPAYLTPDPNDGLVHPAIIWIIGGLGNSLESIPWEEAEPENDQSASAFRENGIVMMYPSFRGGNKNPGYQEYFYGEVDDIIAAAKYLAALPYVDSDRIYLGGHSTGGTLALLAAESTDLFRAVFAFGPVDKIDLYGFDFPFDESNRNELAVRSPIYWLSSINTTTFVIEGSDINSNVDCLLSLRQASKNDNINFCIVEGFDHFNVLKPGCEIIADKILSDSLTEPAINIEAEEFFDWVLR